jgi:hypothetical protein
MRAFTQCNGSMEELREHRPGYTCLVRGLPGTVHLPKDLHFA